MPSISSSLLFGTQVEILYCIYLIVRFVDSMLWYVFGKDRRLSLHQTPGIQIIFQVVLFN